MKKLEIISEKNKTISLDVFKEYIELDIDSWPDFDKKNKWDRISFGFDLNNEKHMNALKKMVLNLARSIKAHEKK
jgi:hypothetical protein